MTESELKENCIRLRTYITSANNYTDIDVTKEAIVQHSFQDGHCVTLTAEAHPSLDNIELPDNGVVEPTTGKEEEERIVRNEWDE
jgi:hypothetical protein